MPRVSKKLVPTLPQHRFPLQACSGVHERVCFPRDFTHAFVRHLQIARERTDMRIARGLRADYMPSMPTVVGMFAYLHDRRTYEFHFIDRLAEQVTRDTSSGNGPLGLYTVSEDELWHVLGTRSNSEPLSPPIVPNASSGLVLSCVFRDANDFKG